MVRANSGGRFKAFLHHIAALGWALDRVTGPER